MERSETPSKSCRQMKQKRFTVRKLRILKYSFFLELKKIYRFFFFYFQVWENTAYVQTALSSSVCLVSMKLVECGSPR